MRLRLVEALVRLKSQIAVITGAGSGIGRAIALRFAAEGARIVVAELHEASGAETTELVRSRGGDALAIATDVGRSDSVAGLFAALDARGLIPDILVNNAGNAAPLTPVHEMSDEAWDAIVHVHLNGTFYGTREALRRMLPRGSGAIINLGSVAGLRGLPGGASYTAAKGAIIAFTKGVAQEVGKKGIRVNCIAPGWVQTPILAHAPDALIDRTVAASAMGRVGTPEEIAAVAAFLASDEASFLTGQVISPNGGSYT
jgi:NAD(P)-dependent dehydrogenase (short-subunit alcohol dehydrogenase family)